jgi:hypothetical protein
MERPQASQVRLSLGLVVVAAVEVHQGLELLVLAALEVEELAHITHHQHLRQVL